MVNKETLRKVYLEKRKLLAPAEYLQRNKLLNQRIIDFVTAKKLKDIHLFLPIKKFNEVDLMMFIQWANSLNELNLIATISDLSTPVMSHFLLEEDTVLVENKWGIPEPSGATEYAIENLDCVLVPMVIGSKSGHRIGYGKGYYDRFLMQCKESTLLVGLNLGPLLEGSLFTDQYDIKMDYILTPFQGIKTEQ